MTVRNIILQSEKNIMDRNEATQTHGESQIDSLVHTGGYTRGEASVQEVYDLNYLGREIKRGSAAIEALNELVAKLDRTKTAQSR